MRFHRVLAACVAGACCMAPAHAQTVASPTAVAVPAPVALPSPTSVALPVAGAQIDPVIARAIAHISADRLRAIDTQLVAFGTRSTFSEDLGARRGVFAARAWIAAQFRGIARSSGGRMTVSYDSYRQAANGKTIPREVEISSIIATLRGDEPGDRTYVMSSHFDSRNSSASDAAKDAPGADATGREPPPSSKPPASSPQFRSTPR